MESKCGNHEQLLVDLQEAHETICALRRELVQAKEENDALHNNERHLRLLFDDAPLGDLIIDENARIKDLNRAFAELLGYAREELIGRDFAELLADEEGLEYHAISFPLYKRRGIAKNVPWRLRKKNGDVVHVLMYGRAQYAPDGRFLYGHGVLVDTTKRELAEKELIKSEREKMLILEVMPDRVIFSDTDMKIIWGNRVAAEMARLTPDMLAGSACSAVCQGSTEHATPCFECPAIRALQSQESCTGEIRSNGRTLAIAAYPVKYDTGGCIGVVQVARDITERKALEKQLLESCSNERWRIGQDLHDGMGQILTGMTFLATSLQRNIAAKLPSEAETAGQIVQYATKSLAMIRSVLRGLCPVSEDSGGLMSALAALAANFQELYHIDCRFEYDKQVLIPDFSLSNHLYFIAHEALANAVKHSGCSAVAIKLHRDNGSVRLSVHDNGCGMDNHVGKGMGLQIMKYRASMIDATLKIENHKTGGTWVVCVAPL